MIQAELYVAVCCILKGTNYISFSFMQLEFLCNVNITMLMGSQYISVDPARSKQQKELRGSSCPGMKHSELQIE